MGATDRKHETLYAILAPARPRRQPLRPPVGHAQLVAGARNRAFSVPRKRICPRFRVVTPAGRRPRRRAQAGEKTMAEMPSRSTARVSPSPHPSRNASPSTPRSTPTASPGRRASPRTPSSGSSYGTRGWSCTPYPSVCDSARGWWTRRSRRTPSTSSIRVSSRPRSARRSAVSTSRTSVRSSPARGSRFSALQLSGGALFLEQSQPVPRLSPVISLRDPCDPLPERAPLGERPVYRNLI